MWRCLISTRAWWMDLASPCLKTWGPPKQCVQRHKHRLLCCLDMFLTIHQAFKIPSHPTPYPINPGCPRALLAKNRLSPLQRSHALHQQHHLECPEAFNSCYPNKYIIKAFLSATFSQTPKVNRKRQLNTCQLQQQVGTALSTKWSSQTQHTTDDKKQKKARLL